MSKIIEALRQAADLLDSEFGILYEFQDYRLCQIGFLTQVLLWGDVTDKELCEVYGDDADNFIRDFIQRRNRTAWRDIFENVEFCKTTGIPIPEIFHELTNAGLTTQMIRDIEGIGDNPKEAAKYMRYLANELETKHDKG